MKLYKYRPINQFIDSIIIANKIWYPKRKQLNDPEDLLLAIYNDVTIDIYKEFLIKRSLNEYRANKFLRDNFRQAFIRNKLTDKAKNKIEKALNKMQSQFDGLGILCLSEHADNDFLWDRYADNYKGICIEFELPANEYLLKVTYTESRPKLKLSELLLGDDGEIMIVEVLRTKTMKWNDEEEWRYFIKKGNVEFPFLGNITGVKFGKMAIQSNKDMIVRLIDSSGNRIKIYD